MKILKSNQASVGIWLLLISCLTGCNACTEQHDPRQHRASIKAESEQANKEAALLNEDGSYPEVSVQEEAQENIADANPAAQKFATYCSACHGADGQANGPTAMAMNPRPRNLTDAAWQESVDDARIYKVIKEGGASVGLSATMTAWGGLLSEDDLQSMVKYVRSLKN